MPALPDDWTLPGVTDLNEAWFTSGALMVQTCASCAARQHPPEEICHRCGAMEFTTTKMAPRGTIHSYTIVHYAVNPALADAIPYAVVLVTLDDDPDIRVVANVVDVEPGAVEIGLAVTAVWQERSDEFGTVQLPQWTLD